MKLFVLWSLLFFVSCSSDIMVQKVDHYYEIVNKKVICVSICYKYKECTFKIQENAYDFELTMVKQYSDSICKLDETFGVVSDNVLYVDEGCRGKFNIKYKVRR